MFAGARTPRWCENPFSHPDRARQCENLSRSPIVANAKILSRSPDPTRKRKRPVLLFGPIFAPRTRGLLVNKYNDPFALLLQLMWSGPTRSTPDQGNEAERIQPG